MAAILDANLISSKFFRFFNNNIFANRIANKVTIQFNAGSYLRIDKTIRKKGEHSDRYQKCAIIRLTYHVS